jgi:hypothetical protein
MCILRGMSIHTRYKSIVWFQAVKPTSVLIAAVGLAVGLLGCGKLVDEESPTALPRDMNDGWQPMTFSNHDYSSLLGVVLVKGTSERAFLHASFSKNDRSLVEASTLGACRYTHERSTNKVDGIDAGPIGITGRSTVESVWTSGSYPVKEFTPEGAFVVSGGGNKLVEAFKSPSFDLPSAPKLTLPKESSPGDLGSFGPWIKREDDLTIRWTEGSGKVLARIVVTGAKSGGGFESRTILCEADALVGTLTIASALLGKLDVRNASSGQLWLSTVSGYVLTRGPTRILAFAEASENPQGVQVVFAN